MNTDALELALALHQAPIRRFSLRDRPLPDNLDEVLQLASAMQPQLQAAAVRFSESEATIVEAVRFYLQQILFEPGTDAYRIFGVEPNAEFKQVRQHHIWLQRWLHPDRRGDDWEAALTTKVNWAWQQLRNESSRDEYDRSRMHYVVEDAHNLATTRSVQIAAWSAEPARPRGDWLRRTVAGSLLALCVVVLYLASTRQDRVDPDVFAAHSNAGESGIRPRLPFTDGSHPDSQQPVSYSDAATATSNHVESTALKASALPLNGRLAATLSGSGIADTKRLKPAPIVEKVGKRTAVLSLEAVARPAANPLRSAESVAARRKYVEPAELATVGTESSPASRRQQRRAARAALRASNRALAASAALEVVTPVDELPRTNGDNRSALVLRNATANVGDNAVVATETTGHSNPSAAKSPTAVDVQRSAEQPMLANDIRRPAPVEPDPSNIQKLAIVPPASTLASEPAQPSPSAAAAQPSTAEIERATLVRFELARARVRSMVSYFSGANTIPPKWNDEPGRSTVARERKILHQRSGEVGIDRFVLDPPAWQISHSAVSLDASYHVNAKRASAESGRMRLDMVWNDRSWKITRIELSPES